jgi:hypothetical protein
VRAAGPVRWPASGNPIRGIGSVTSRASLLLLILAGLVLFSGERRSESAWAYPAPLVERQRYGFVAGSPTWRKDFDFSQLRGGWYVDVSLPACAINPEGMDRALLLRVRDWKTSPQWSWLESMIDSHPGSLWLVGNEPDCIWQDNLLPEDYADIYHEIYSAIKTRDPTALVSPGGIVQPTPLRLAWLDRVLQQYESVHGSQMPVDVWNIHNQILQEVVDDWGADIPPGIDPEGGIIRDPWDNYRVDIFEEQIWAFREWMALNEYDGYPLIVSEFGILMPEGWWDYDADDVNVFMDATFEFLRTATSNDPNTLGDPTDGHRLVQRWAWFGLDNPPYDAANPQPQTFNGNLFDPYTTLITGYGLNYATHTASFPPLDYVDLRPGRLWFEPLGPVGPGELVNRTVEVEVQNLGSLDSGAFAVRLEYDGSESGQSQSSVDNLAAGESAWLAFELIQLSQGVYDIAVWVDSDSEVSETTDCDNQLESIMVVPADVVYLPLIAR